MRNFKKIICGCLVLVLCLIFTKSTVFAATDCVKYKDYYFFVDIMGEESFNNLKASTSTWSVTNNTYYEALPSTRQSFNNGKQVCVFKTNECDNWGGMKMSAQDFYTYYLQAIKSNTTKKITIDGGSKTTTIRYYETMDGSNAVVRYISHGKWTKQKTDGTDEEHDSSVDVSGVAGAAAALASGSFIPTDVTITMAYDKADSSGYQSMTATIIRTISAGKAAAVTNGVVPFQVMWNSAQTNSVLSPALYYDEYEVCEENTSYTQDMYNAKIYYLYKDTNRTAATTYTRQYTNGATDKVVSPTISGCTADLPTVDIKIVGKNFEKTVYYTCAAASNPPTGNILFIVCMIVGFSSLAYFLYWLFVGRKKASNEV